VVSLLREIAAQGEGYEEPEAGSPSHFRRLFALYEEARGFLQADPNNHLADPVPVNPSTSDPDAPGYLGFLEARFWGAAFNHRYRWVLLSVAHHLLIPEQDPARQQLLQWAIVDMHVLSKMAGLLRGLPQQLPPRLDARGRAIVAGAPLELPHSLALPARPVDRWREHARIAGHHIAQLKVVADQGSAGPMLAEVRDRIRWIEKQIEEST
jgi:hypothetical protein